ncbi:pyridoxal phosphate-dependent transferase [Mycena alexandri]|uniref:Pyridoxal phosphate-dependent transferase n=1 Tax=Mycena alexandri TaxID=1745969 RepID=A0AAD6X8F3_9AGAR|nr:pyridoxal phosphate-dependent transferase [Mycena alexandri]
MSSLSFRLSRGVLNTITPPIPLAYTWAAKYRLSHGPLLDMSQGIPGVPPQRSLQEALSVAASSLGSFGYCPSEGELVLREAMADEMRTVYGTDTDIDPGDMSLTSGCNLAFVATIMTLADAGDEVILPVPWFVLDHMTLTMLNITTVPLQTRPDEGFAPSVSQCKALITPKTRAIVLVTPNNPTGATYSPELIVEFSRLAHDHGIALIIDETYRDFILTELPPHSLFTEASWREHFIHLFSFSKSYGVPGHRLGLVLAIAPILASLRPGIVETALGLQARRELFKNALPPGWVVGAIGGYFAWTRHPFPGRGSAEVCQRLAEELGVVLLPAAFFCDESNLDKSDDRWIRFSVANCDDDRVRAVCARLTQCGALFGWESDA